MDFPIIPCNLCGSQENLQRKVIKDLLKQWDRQYPGRIESMASALQNVVPSHLADTALFEFKSVQATGEENSDGDTAFDHSTPTTFLNYRDEEDGQSLADESGVIRVLNLS